MVPLLQAIKSIIPVTAQEEELIGTLFKKRGYSKESFFVSEGEVCKYVGFIVEGVMRFYINDNGEEKTYGFIKENSFISNYGSFVPQTPSLQNIQALEDCRLYVISHADLQKFYRDVQHGERLGRLVIEQVFIQMLQDLNSFYTDTPEMRYDKFLTQNADLRQRIR